MSQNIEQRIVQIEFENKEFEKNIKQSQESLRKLKEELNFKDGTIDYEELNKAVQSTDFTPVVRQLDKTSKAFSTMEIVAISAINRITNKLMALGESFLHSVNVEPIAKGWQKYEEQLGATQLVFMALKGTTESAAQAITDYGDRIRDAAKQTGDLVNNETNLFSAVKEALDDVAWFADETSYSMTTMTDGLSKFINQGVSLKNSVTALEGIAAWTASCGGNAQVAARMYTQLSQVLGRNMMAQDWNSVVNANMGTESAKKIFFDKAVEAGTLRKTTDATTGAVHYYVNSVTNAASELSNGFVAISDLISSGNEVTMSNFKDMLQYGFITPEVQTAFYEEYGKFTATLQSVMNKMDDSTDLSSALTDMRTSKWRKLIKVYDEYEGELKSIEQAEGEADDAYQKRVKDTIAKLTDQDALVQGIKAVNADFTQSDIQYIIENLRILGDEELAFSKDAFFAVQEAKTLTEALNSLKENAATAWQRIFTSVFGDYIESRDQFTDLADDLIEIFVTPVSNVADVLEKWAKDTNHVSFSEGFFNVFKAINSFITPIRDTIAEFFGLDGDTTIERINQLARAFNKFTESLIIDEEWGSFLGDIMEFFLDIGKTARDLLLEFKPIILAIGKAVLNVGKTILSVIKAIFGSDETDEVAAVNEDLESFDDTLNNITETTKKAKEVLSPLASIFGSIADGVKGVATAISESEVLSKILTTGGNIISGAVDGISNILSSIFSPSSSEQIEANAEAYKAKYKEVWSGIADVFKKSNEKVEEVVNDVQYTPDPTESNVLSSDVYYIGGAGGQSTTLNADESVKNKKKTEEAEETTKSSLETFYENVGVIGDIVEGITLRVKSIDWKGMYAALGAAGIAAIIYLMLSISEAIITASRALLLVTVMIIPIIKQITKSIIEIIAAITIAFNVTAYLGTFINLAIGGIIVGIGKLLSGFGNLMRKISGVKKAVATIPSLILSLSALFAGIALVIGAIVAAKLADVDINDITTILGKITGCIGMIVLMLAAAGTLTAIFGKQDVTHFGLNTTSIKKIFSGDFSGGWTETSSPIWDMYPVLMACGFILLSFAACIAAIALAIYNGVDSKILTDAIDTISQMIMAVTMALGLITIIIAIAENANNKQDSSVSPESNSKGALDYFHNITSGIGLIVIGIAGVIAAIGWALDMIGVENADVILEFVTIMFILTGLMGLLVFAIGKFMSSGKSNTKNTLFGMSFEKDNTAKNLKAAAGSIAIILLSIAAFAASMALVASMANALGGVEALDEIEGLIKTVMHMVLAIGIVLSLLMLVMRSWEKSSDNGGLTDARRGSGKAYTVVGKETSESHKGKSALTLLGASVAISIIISSISLFVWSMSLLGPTINALGGNINGITSLMESILWIVVAVGAIIVSLMLISSLLAKSTEKTQNDSILSKKKDNTALNLLSASVSMAIILGAISAFVWSMSTLEEVVRYLNGNISAVESFMVTIVHVVASIGAIIVLMTFIMSLFSKSTKEADGSSKSDRTAINLLAASASISIVLGAMALFLAEMGVVVGLIEKAGVSIDDLSTMIGEIGGITMFIGVVLMLMAKFGTTLASDGKGAQSAKSSLIKAALAVSIVLGAIALILYAISKVANECTALNADVVTMIGTGMITAAVAIGLIAAALAGLSKIDSKKIVTAAAIVSAVLAMIVGIYAALGYLLSNVNANNKDTIWVAILGIIGIIAMMTLAVVAVAVFANKISGIKIVSLVTVGLIMAVLAGAAIGIMYFLSKLAEAQNQWTAMGAASLTMFIGLGLIVAAMYGLLLIAQGFTALMATGVGVAAVTAIEIIVVALVAAIIAMMMGLMAIVSIIDTWNNAVAKTGLTNMFALISWLMLFGVALGVIGNFGFEGAVALLVVGAALAVASIGIVQFAAGIKTFVEAYGEYNTLIKEGTIASFSKFTTDLAAGIIKIGYATYMVKTSEGVSAFLTAMSMLGISMAYLDDVNFVDIGNGLATMINTISDAIDKLDSAKLANLASVAKGLPQAVATSAILTGADYSIGGTGYTASASSSDIDFMEVLDKILNGDYSGLNMESFTEGIGSIMGVDFTSLFGGGVTSSTYNSSSLSNGYNESGATTQTYNATYGDVNITIHVDGEADPDEIVNKIDEALKSRQMTNGSTTVANGSSGGNNYNPTYA